MNRVLSILFFTLIAGAVLGIAIIGTRMELPEQADDSQCVEDLRRIIAEKDAIIARQRRIIAEKN